MENNPQSNVDHSIIQLDGSWVEHMTTELDKATHEEASLEHTIHRVPESIQRVDVDAKNVYEPYIISFGPYHHGKSNLQEMEEKKWRCLRRYLSRNKEKYLVDYLKELKEKETKMRNCYSGRIDMESNKFVEMMMLDACFILEHLLYRMDLLKNCSIWFYSRLQHDMLLLENQIPFFILEWLCNLNGTPRDIPLWQWAIDFVTNGALIYKNISGTEIHHFLHLYHLYFLPSSGNDEPSQSNPAAAAAETPSSGNGEPSQSKPAAPTANGESSPAEQPEISSSGNEESSPSQPAPQSNPAAAAAETPSSGIEVPSQSNPATPPETPSSGNGEPSQSKPAAPTANDQSSPSQPAEPPEISSPVSSPSQPAPPPETPSPGNEVPLTIPSATELREAGVKFVAKKGKSFLDIEFNNGVMTIPELVIYDGTYSLFRNLIVFEQCYLKSQTPFTNYALFMDFIINTPKDVEILSKKKIISHWLGSHEEVALLFNKLCKGVVGDDENNYLSQQLKQVTDFYGTPWHTWRANLMRVYFRNPWTMISLVAAFILLSLTITQTIFTILQYVHP